MTQPSRTTETINRDNAAIRDIMHQIRELTVPDRATLALGLIGHLATMMNRHQMDKLMSELAEEAHRVQDVPPSRQRDDSAREADADSDDGDSPAGTHAAGAAGGSGRESRGDARTAPGRNADPRTGAANDGARAEGDALDRAAHEGVGQAGRGEFRSGRLV